MEKIKLQKYFTDCGVLSRRKAEEEIAKGKVTVNGCVATIGTRIDPENDTVRYLDKVISPQSGERTYIVLNKPLGYVTTMNDEKGRKTAFQLVSDVGKRVYPVGRLDMYSEGLLIFTDDGELANKLTHPSHSFSKRYMVKIKGKCSSDDIMRLTSPMELDGYALRPIDAELIQAGKVDKEGNIYSTLALTLYEGRNRQIRRMCEKCSLTVMRLKRVSVGNIKLGDLPSGKWRHLTKEETEYLINT
ncbi:MAG: rRNA pseudouridine synthase [Ruminococcaceae bacterium]|nr:rRNA pseudouridine synthase [Oscillospiraceae bacterium]